MKKILYSVAVIGGIAALAIGVTTAFYNDTETSTGNTFTAGSIDLRVDSEAHYNNMVCDDGVWLPDGTGPTVGFPVEGSDCDGTWSETDLEDGVHKFFNFLDIKPGDEGEDTISLHVFENDAWGQFEVENVIDRDNTCTDPEDAVDAEDGSCVDPNGDGEVDNYLTFTGWLDQGEEPGFQCGDPEDNPGARCEDDEYEGDNIYDTFEGPKFWDEVLISDLGPFDLSHVLGAAYSIYNCSSNGEVNGHTDYTECHGLAEDGRMVGSTTYYFGLAWDFPLSSGNDAQTDEYTADMLFRVEQHRNNPSPF